MEFVLMGESQSFVRSELFFFACPRNDLKYFFFLFFLKSYDNIMEKITGDTDVEGSLFFKQAVENSTRLLSFCLTLDTKNQPQLLASVQQQLNPVEGNKNILGHLNKELLQKARFGEMGNLMKEVLNKEEHSSNFDKIRKISTNSLDEAISSANNFIAELEDSSLPKAQPAEAEFVKLNASQSFADMFQHGKMMNFFCASKESSKKR
jgi:hypothetical protein